MLNLEQFNPELGFISVSNHLFVRYYCHWNAEVSMRAQCGPSLGHALRSAGMGIRPPPTWGKNSRHHPFAENFLEREVCKSSMLLIELTWSLQISQSLWCLALSSCQMNSLDVKISWFMPIRVWPTRNLLISADMNMPTNEKVCYMVFIKSTVRM